QHSSSQVGVVVWVIIAAAVGVRSASAGHAVHASSAQITRLWQAEAAVVHKIRTLLTSLNQVINVLQRYVKAWETSGLGDAEPSVRFGDAVSAFTLLTHVAHGWRLTDRTLHEHSHVTSLLSESLLVNSASILKRWSRRGRNGRAAELSQRADDEDLPDEVDAVRAGEAVARLLNVYRLDASSFFRGRQFPGRPRSSLKEHQQEDDVEDEAFSEPKLPASALAHLGLLAINKGMFGISVDLLKAAREEESGFARRQQRDPALRQETPCRRKYDGELREHPRQRNASEGDDAVRRDIVHGYCSSADGVEDEVESEEQVPFGPFYSFERIEAMLSTAVKVHDHVLSIRGPSSGSHSTAGRPYGTSLTSPGGTTSPSSPASGRRSGIGRDLKVEDEVKDEVEVVLGVEYLKRHGNKTWMLRQRLETERLQAERLCRGHDLRPMVLRSSLSCRYMTNGSPWLRLAPFKAEVVNDDPYIVLIYDVISRDVTRRVTSQLTPRLHTPHHPMTKKKENSTISDWSLKQTWVTEDEMDDLRDLTRRLEHLLGVVADGGVSEPFMVANYGLAGEYPVHSDTHGPFVRPPFPRLGDRLGSALTFLSAPAAGGRTVFPWLGVGVEPVEGATLVWWNLLASHEYELLTRHAACPVLRGHNSYYSRLISVTELNLHIDANVLQPSLNVMQDTEGSLPGTEIDPLVHNVST
ncbi:uncharacterized protein LOC143028300, partial [Oratosquilla oratoria]|uniref:uncharacterized protein LOC143028300 n=1 Tax=Oratosquilla oratoria TaxID=337810 RepID=UPI003F7672B7